MGGGKIEDVYTEIENLKEICAEFNSMKQTLIDNNKEYHFSATEKPYANVNSGNILTINAYRKGAFVTVHVGCVMDTGGNRGSTLSEFSLPEGFRPMATVFQTTSQVTGSSYDNGNARWQINSAGKGTIQMDATAYYERHATFTYFTNSAFPDDQYLLRTS